MFEYDASPLVVVVAPTLITPGQFDGVCRDAGAPELFPTDATTLIPAANASLIAFS